MTTIIYAVSTGSYSDYRVDALFSTEQLAQDYIDSLRTHAHMDNPRIEQYRLDEYTDKLKAGLLPWMVFMQRDGSTDDDSIREVSPDFDTTQHIVINSGNIYEINLLIRVHCWARDKDHAVKIANERRTVAILAGEFEKAEQKALKLRESENKRRRKTA